MFNFILWHVNIQFSYHHLLIRLSFPHYEVLAFLLKVSDCMCMGLLLDSLDKPQWWDVTSNVRLQRSWLSLFQVISLSLSLSPFIWCNKTCELLLPHGQIHMARNWWWPLPNSAKQPGETWGPQSTCKELISASNHIYGIGSESSSSLEMTTAVTGALWDAVSENPVKPHTDSWPTETEKFANFCLDFDYGITTWRFNFTLALGFSGSLKTSMVTYVCVYMWVFLSEQFEEAWV